MQEFLQVKLVSGTILEVNDFPEAIKPAYKLLVDLGQYGIKKSSAQITDCYSKNELIGKRVICVVNFPPKKIAGYTSEVLVTGFYNEKNKVILATIDGDVPNGVLLS